MLEPAEAAAARPAPADGCTAFWLGTVNFPGDFERLPDIVKQLLGHADTIELQFHRGAASASDKFGIIKACFSSPQDATQCYENLNDQIVASERRWNLSWLPEEVIAPVDRKTTPADHAAEDAGGYLLISGFPITMGSDAIVKLLGEQNVLDIVMNEIPTGGGISSCIVKFKTPQLATEAESRFQSYELVVGNEKSRLVVQPYPTAQSETCQFEEAMDTVQEISTNAVESAMELSAEQIQLYLKQLMVRDRINWAELNTEEELWALLNKFTKEIGWQPEETLKDAMMLTLRAAVEEMGDYGWMTDHLNTLIRKWSKVVENMTKSKTRRRLQLMDAEQSNAAGADYVPPPAEKSRKRRKNRGQGLMTVGGLLSAIKGEAIKAADLENGSPPKRRSCRRRDESSESGEASSSSGESVQGDCGGADDFAKRSPAKGPVDGGSPPDGCRSNTAQPELVDQVVSSVLRMMPMINEWRASKMSSANASADRPPPPPPPPPPAAAAAATPVRQDVASMNFTVPPPPLPRLPFGFFPPQATGTLPTNCSVLLGGIPVVPPPPPAAAAAAGGGSGQPMQTTNFTANPIAPFYCIPPPGRKF